MEKKLIISFLIVVGVIAIFYFINLDVSTTGYVVGEISQESLDTPLNASVVQQDAISALNNSEKQLQMLKERGLPIFYTEDMYEEALVVYQQAYYAEILRGDYSDEEKSLASEELKLVNWRKIDYSDVLIYSDAIDKHFDKVFVINDYIEIEKNKLKNYAKQNFEISEESKELLNKTIEAFNNDQLTDAEKFLEDYRNSVENDLSELSTLGALEKNTKNFIQRYWIQLILLLVFLVGIFFYFYGRYNLSRLEHRISRMKHEREILVELIKKTQNERFNQGSIPNLVYNVRMEKYKEKLDEIKQQLPVLESKYKRMSGKKKKIIKTKKKRVRKKNRNYPKESHPKVEHRKIKKKKKKESKKRKKRKNAK